MTTNDATEVAYKNGYEAGKREMMERIEKALDYLCKCREVSFYKQTDSKYSNTRVYYIGKYVAYQKSIEVIKRALEGKNYGK
jgi:hypothetical protein